MPLPIDKALKVTAKDAARRHWQREWQRTPAAGKFVPYFATEVVRQSSSHIVKAEQLYRMNDAEWKFALSVRSNSVSLNPFLHKIARAESPNCPHGCNAPETLGHFLNGCPWYNNPNPVNGCGNCLWNYRHDMVVNVIKSNLPCDRDDLLYAGVVPPELRPAHPTPDQVALSALKPDLVWIRRLRRPTGGHAAAAAAALADGGGANTGAPAYDIMEVRLIEVTVSFPGGVREADEPAVDQNNHDDPQQQQRRQPDRQASGDRLWSVLDNKAQLKVAKYESLRQMVAQVHPQARIEIVPLVFASIGFASQATMDSLQTLMTRSVARRVAQCATVCILQGNHAMWKARCGKVYGPSSD
jgi:hypothetical protein